MNEDEKGVSSVQFNEPTVFPSMVLRCTHAVTSELDHTTFCAAFSSLSKFGMTDFWLQF